VTPAGSDSGDWNRSAGRIVVIDTNSSYLYIGTLAEVTDHFLKLRDVDVHDRTETPTTKEKYILDAKRYGVKCNRREVSIRKEVVTSFSLLDDILDY
jgi:hypothetical protein